MGAGNEAFNICLIRKNDNKKIIFGGYIHVYVYLLINRTTDNLK